MNAFIYKFMFPPVSQILYVNNVDLANAKVQFIPLAI